MHASVRVRLAIGVAVGILLVVVGRTAVPGATGRLIASVGAGVAAVAVLVLIVIVATGRDRF
jgi:hypothetical protein